MASIHGFWFILVGTVVSVISLLNQDLLIPFIFVGIAFFLYGSGKIIIKITKKNKTHQNHANHNTKNNNQHHKQQNPQQHMFFCKKCGNRLKIHDNFCSHCGIQLKEINNHN